jgi:hypothetical protein
MSIKNKFITSFFDNYDTVDIFPSVFKDNNSLRSHKSIEIKDFINFFCLFMEGSGSVQIITDPDLRDPKASGSSGSGALDKSVINEQTQKIYFCVLCNIESSNLRVDGHHGGSLLVERLSAGIRVSSPAWQRNHFPA